MTDTPRPTHVHLIHVYLVMITQGPERRYVEVEAPDIETAASIGDGIVVAMRGSRPMRAGES